MSEIIVLMEISYDQTLRRAYSFADKTELKYVKKHVKINFCHLRVVSQFETLPISEWYLVY